MQIKERISNKEITCCSFQFNYLWLFLPRGQLKTTSKSTKTSSLLWKIFWILLFFYETLISIFIIGTYGATCKKIHAPKETSLRWQFWSRYFIDLHCFHFHTHVLPFYFFSFTLITKIISVPLSRLYIQISKMFFI